MIDLIEEIALPTKGLVYDQPIKWQNRLRAPRLCDKGIGDLTRKNKLQASILDKTVLEPLGISAYDLHTADFLYLNFIQRQMAKGSSDYHINVFCYKCGENIDVNFDLSQVKVNYLAERPDMTFKTLDGVELELNFPTPRMFDDANQAADEFKEEYPDSESDARLQELLRRLVKTIDGQKMTHSQKTEFINNLYMSDVQKILSLTTDFNFGLDLNQTMVCPHCGKKIKFIVPV